MCRFLRWDVRILQQLWDVFSDFPESSLSVQGVASREQPGDVLPSFWDMQLVWNELLSMDVFSQLCFIRDMCDPRCKGIYGWSRAQKSSNCFIFGHKSVRILAYLTLDVRLFFQICFQKSRMVLDNFIIPGCHWLIISEIFLEIKRPNLAFLSPNWYGRFLGCKVCTFLTKFGF